MISLILIGYIIFLLIWGMVSFLALYQLSRFGYVGDASKRAIAVYILAGVILVILTIVAIAIAFS